MFIQNMTSRELVQEFHLDLLEIQTKHNTIVQSSYVSNLLNKNRKNNSFMFVKYCTTARHNTYINVFVYTKDVNSTRKSTKWGWDVYSFGLMQTHKGTCAIGFFDDFQIAIVFQPHFFLRYKERFSKICDWKTRGILNQAKKVEDIIPIYVRRNPITTWINTKVKYKNKEHVFAPINDGVALIQFDGENIQANTFITEDMYSSQQYNLIEKSKCFDQLQQEKDKLFQILMSLMNEE